MNIQPETEKFSHRSVLSNITRYIEKSIEDAMNDKY